MSKAKSDKVSPDLDTPTDLPQAAVNKISASLNVLLADAFALYLKTKNFHWHVSGRHFRDYHLMLDQQSDDIFATTDQLAERVRKLGGTTLRSIGQIGKLQTIKDNDESYVTPREMLREQVQSALGALSERERQVLELRFGLIDGKDHTLEEVSRYFNVTRERIRQIEAKALRKLRHPTRSRHLREYLA